jgi:hypothetical protein
VVLPLPTESVSDADDNVGPPACAIQYHDCHCCGFGNSCRGVLKPPERVGRCDRQQRFGADLASVERRLSTRAAIVEFGKT